MCFLNLVSNSFDGKDTKTCREHDIVGILRSINRKSFWESFLGHIYIANLESDGAPPAKNCTKAMGKNEDDSSWLCIGMRIGLVLGDFVEFSSSKGLQCTYFGFINETKDQYYYTVRSELVPWNFD